MSSLLQRLGALLCVLICAVPTAALALDLDQLARDVAARDWTAATTDAAALDSKDGGQLFAVYVAAARAAADGRCVQAAPAFDALSKAQPYFVPAYEQAYLCYEQLGDKRAATQRLASMLAILPPGTDHDLVDQLYRREQARGRPSIEVHGGLAPSTNANRATAAQTLPGSDWTILERAKPGVLASAGASATFDLYSRPGSAAAGVLGVDASYSTATGLLSPTLSTELPLTFGSLGGTQAVVAPFASLGFEERAPSSWSVGIRGLVSKPFSSTFRAAIEGSVAYADYPQQSWRDGIEVNTDLSASWLIDPSTQLSGRLSAAYDATFAATWRTLDLTAQARVDRLLPAGFLVALQAEAGARFHASPPPMLPPGSPNQLDLHAAARVELANRNLAVGPFIPVLYYQYQVQRSDNVFYAWQAQDVGVTLRAKF